MAESGTFTVPVQVVATVTTADDVAIGDVVDETRAEWSTAYVNDLPDSSFACVDGAGRHYPHHNADGNLDLPHLRNALSRVAQDDTTSCGVAHLRAHARAEGIGETRSEDDAPGVPGDEPDPGEGPAETPPADPVETPDEAGPDDDQAATPPADPVEVDVPDPDAVQVRSAALREIDVRLVPWDTPIDTVQGREQFARGAFDDVRADDVYLMGLEHEAHIGLGQDGAPRLVRRPIGRGIALDPTVPRVTFRVAKTAAGDELLALADERIVRGVSVEFHEVPGGTTTETVRGRRTRTHRRVALTGASLTYRPAYGDQAAVLAVRSHENTGGTYQMTENTSTAVQVVDGAPSASFDMDSFFARLAERDRAWTDRIEDAIDKVETRARLDITVPVSEAQERAISRGEWAETVIKILAGDRVPDVQMRALQDVITSDNAGVVPPAYLSELIGVIDTSRPFLASTRRLPTPASGMQMIVPVINQRPTTGVQATEKTDVSSQKTLIGTTAFDAVSIAGAGDISIQTLKRASRSFLDLWLELLAEAYAIDCEDIAVTALLNAMGGAGAAGPLDPENLNLGAAFVSSFDAIRRPPDTIWLSTEAVGEFIDAKATTTNAPLYPGLSASATAAGGITGVISGLRPVHVPALDEHGAYAIVGPSSGMAWAEDGTYTLQADDVSKAGRNIGLIGLLWACPWYPDAFTAYNVAS